MVKEVPLGTVSHGTMRNEDLIPDFLSLLEELSPEEHAKVLASYPEYVPDNIESFDFDSDVSMYLLERLFDELNALSPEGYYFGAHPGDGSDYGFWEDENYEEV